MEIQQSNNNKMKLVTTVEGMPEGVEYMGTGSDEVRDRIKNSVGYEYAEIHSEDMIHTDLTNRSVWAGSVIGIASKCHYFRRKKKAPKTTIEELYANGDVVYVKYRNDCPTILVTHVYDDFNHVTINGVGKQHLEKLANKAVRWTNNPLTA